VKRLRELVFCGLLLLVALLVALAILVDREKFR
jgi:hypothetical protein